MKRAFDLWVSGLTLMLVLPIVCLAALAVRARLGAPVLFSQKRAGLHGAPFRLYKFRSMTDAKHADGRLLSDAQRLTPFGYWLRSTSIDELPALWNVLRGDMSLVGPRPLLLDYLPLYSAEQRRRHDVQPGITGWAQINGRNAISWEDKFRLDVWYVDNCSLILDMRIILRTIGKVVHRDGISSSSEVTMPRFVGTQTEIASQVSPVSVADQSDSVEP